MVVSTTAFLVAGRFGLAPTLKQQATSGLRLVDNGTKGLSTGDPAGIQQRIKPLCILAAVQQLVCIPETPCKLSQAYCSPMWSAELTYAYLCGLQSSHVNACAGFTAVDVLGHGTMGHVIGTGAILSLRVSIIRDGMSVSCTCIVCANALTPACSLQALGKI